MLYQRIEFEQIWRFNEMELSSAGWEGCECSEERAGLELYKRELESWPDYLQAASPWPVSNCL